MLRATTACNFSSLLWPAGSAPAALASLLVDPPEPQIIGKTPCFVTFLPFRAPGSSFLWDFLFSDLLSSSLLFSILLLHLCFSSFHIVGSLTSKLPSATYFISWFSQWERKKTIPSPRLQRDFLHRQELAEVGNPFHLMIPQLTPEVADLNVELLHGWGVLSSWIEWPEPSQAKK